MQLCFLWTSGRLSLSPEPRRHLLFMPVVHCDFGSQPKSGCSKDHTMYCPMATKPCQSRGAVLLFFAESGLVNEQKGVDTAEDLSDLSIYDRTKN